MSVPSVVVVFVVVMTTRCARDLDWNLDRSLDSDLDRAQHGLGFTPNLTERGSSSPAAGARRARA